MGIVHEKEKYYGRIIINYGLSDTVSRSDFP